MKKKKITTVGATIALVMSMGTAAFASPAAPGTGTFDDPQLHAGHRGYAQSDFKAKGVPADVFHNGGGYATGLGGWAEEVKQGGPFK